MKVKAGVKYYTISEVAAILNLSRLTIYNYYRFSKQCSSRLPLPNGRRDLDKRKTIYYSEKDIVVIKRFIRFKKRGDMLDFYKNENDELYDDLFD